MSPTELNKFLLDHNLVAEDAIGCIEFVQDLLEYMVKKLKEEEPYATNTIERMEIAAREVSCLTYPLEELI